MTLSVVIAAGGTGGHLVPAVAVADALRHRHPDAAVTFAGTSRAVESEILQAAGYRSVATAVRPFTRDVRGLIAPLSMLPATVQAARILRRERAQVVVGMGGYPSLPAIAAARVLGVPSLIHEANAIPGLANEVAARMTPNVAVSFPEALRAFKRRTPRLVGVPLRAEIESFDRDALRARALEGLALDQTRKTVLMFGGSLGARRLNDAALGMAMRWRDRRDLQLLVIAGTPHRDALASAMPSGDLLVRCHAYLERMELAYALADVAVCRAGASTVAELAATGVPAVLVPLPVARRNEQHHNAAALARAGAAQVLDDASATPDVLVPLVAELLADEARRTAMSEAATSLAHPHAATSMASWIEELAR